MAYSTLRAPFSRGSRSRSSTMARAGGISPISMILWPRSAASWIACHLRRIHERSSQPSPATVLSPVAPLPAGEYRRRATRESDNAGGCPGKGRWVCGQARIPAKTAGGCGENLRQRGSVGSADRPEAFDATGYRHSAFRRMVPQALQLSLSLADDGSAGAAYAFRIEIKRAVRLAGNCANAIWKFKVDNLPCPPQQGRLVWVHLSFGGRARASLQVAVRNKRGADKRAPECLYRWCGVPVAWRGQS